MKDDRVYLQQILDCTRNIREFVAGMDNAAFLKDRKTQSAVILQLALIGELAKRVSAPVKSVIAVPWKEIAGFRDRAIHDYFQVDLQIAWDTIAIDLEPLSVAILEYLTGNTGGNPGAAEW
jgi:uncharacterized protein with HEPN domain